MTLELPVKQSNIYFLKTIHFLTLHTIILEFHTMKCPHKTSTLVITMYKICEIW